MNCKEMFIMSLSIFFRSAGQHTDKAGREQGILIILRYRYQSDVKSVMVLTVFASESC